MDEARTPAGCRGTLNASGATRSAMSYYMFEIRDIPVGDNDEPRMVGKGDGDEQMPWLPVTVKELPLEWWKQHYEATDEGCSLCSLSLQDNGEHGDGIQIAIRAGDQDVVWFRLPEESLATLHEALGAIIRLRQAEYPK